ncbi:UDP-glucose 4-epimerase GalE [Variovorax sp. EL159]|uniref:UDP-glucose 4-epimerase GalE n=1 Tax=Variovorax sp. EL159 TaxID=1566270 RepID=UPI00088C6E68|nr:UDP-glucose 4-epimerase GalE [Variovorax sp. EL159]SCX72727.1 UDP-galactose 4-epimerase [Variovorax sp. EL159]
MSHKVLVTGGAGYIGSHTVVELLKANFEVIVVDNLCNSSRVALTRVEGIAGGLVRFYECDIRNSNQLLKVFRENKIESVIHFAGLKAVGESVTDPISYYENNVAGTVQLLKVMRQCDVRTLVFSSSATVYGDPASVPVCEGFPRSATNPYGRSKLIVEDILEDLCNSEAGWRVARLRYFNPVGAHASGEIGEDPRGIPNNLLPYIAQVAIGRREYLSVFGGDYPTIDGTGVRDFIHVVDLAKGHLAALNYLGVNEGLLTANLGTGSGVSVLQMVAAFERACGKSISYKVVDRRPGDVAQCWADPSYAKTVLAWEAQCSLDEMCADAWRWQSKNPNGFVI